MNDTIGKTFGVASGLCLICSILVSSAAVGLRETQERNKRIDVQKNILIAAGDYSDGDDVEAKFKSKVETHLVDLRPNSAGESINFDDIDPDSQFARRAKIDNFDIANYDPRKAAKGEGALDADGLNQISKHEPLAFAYLVKKDGKIDKIVLPIYGKGLWSTLYGFIALEGDAQTVAGITFYEHGETPGLGGEIESEAFKDDWPGLKVFAEDGSVAIQVVKNAKPGTSEVESLSGATITSNGVTNTVQYWLGPKGFGPYLKKLAAASQTSPDDSGESDSTDNKSDSDQEDGDG